MAKGQPGKDPMLERKVNTGGVKSDYTEMRAKDIRALDHAKEMEAQQTGCVTVRLEHGTLTAKPETIYHILTERGYKEKDIDLIMDTAR